MRSPIVEKEIGMDDDDPKDQKGLPTPSHREQLCLIGGPDLQTRDKKNGVRISNVKSDLRSSYGI